jgi:hypothetical protein
LDENLKECNCFVTASSLFKEQNGTKKEYNNFIFENYILEQKIKQNGAKKNAIISYSKITSWNKK